MLVFIVDPVFPWPPGDIDHGVDAQALATFVEQVRTDHVVRRFAELAAFREDLLLALSQQRRTVPLAEAEDGEWRRSRVPPPPAFHAVPPYVGGAPFTGRADDLQLLDDWGRSADPMMVVEAIGGVGKSALAWQWAHDQALMMVPDLAGRFWWSFYEGSASMTRFLQELLAYTTGRSINYVQRLEWADLADEVLPTLCRRQYLIVLDGFERLLAAYHRFDPSKLRDEEVETSQRSLIEPQAEEMIRRLTTAAPSKFLISTRLMPSALQGRFGLQIPGVRYLRLPGLTNADTYELLKRLGVHGSAEAIAGFFGPLGNHPLLVGIVAGLVGDYRPEPGGFDRWLADPTAGGALRVEGLDLTQRSTHILAAALNGLPAWPRQLLGWLSVLSGAVTWPTLEAISPFRPELPGPAQFDLSSLGPEPDPGENPRSPAWLAYRAWHAAREQLIELAGREQLEMWSSSEPVARSRAQLDSALKELEDRGLLWWDRSSNSYDLHPIIRAYTYGQLEGPERIAAHDWICKKFKSMPTEDPTLAASVEDLSRTITIFRSLIGADHLAEARGLWQGRLSKALQANLGAHSTVVELLTPVADDRPLSIDLAISYWFMGRYDLAIGQETSILAAALREGVTVAITFSLRNLSLSLRDAGSIAGASLCCDLSADINDKAGAKTDGSLILYQAMLSAIQGQVKKAIQLLEIAENLGPTGQGWWHQEHIQYCRLYLDLVTKKRGAHTLIMNASRGRHSWQHRRDLAELRCESFIRQEQFEHALVAATEHERLGRNAGLEVAPARSAFLLAKLGRPEEAASAVEEALTRLSRMHHARRPHYHLALALWELRRADEAASHGQEAYRQAWTDGPPYCRHWDLLDAENLLIARGVPVPQLPPFDRTAVAIPLEDAVRAYIAKLKR